MQKLGWVGSSLLVGLVGCGGGSGSSSVTIENFAQKYAEAMCAKNFQCCDASELTGKTQSECVTSNSSVISLLTAEINASQTQGRVSYSASASGMCVDSLKAMTCDEFKQGIGGNMAACMAFIMPKVAMGGACTQSFECTTNNCVGADTSTDPPTDGMCAAALTLAAIGTSCATTECVDGAYCDATSTCQKLKGAGEACTMDSECINSCNTTTNTCSCYAGCQVAEAVTPASAVLSALLLGAGLVVSRARRRRR
jgi:hypothetical protein